MSRRQDRRRGRRWSYTAGHYPYSVRVFDRDGRIYVAIHDPTARSGRGGERKRALGHGDRSEAKRYAEELAVKLRSGVESPAQAPPRLEQVLALYRAHRTPDKCVSSRLEDERQMELWIRVLGREYELAKLSRREWDTFIRDRRSGTIGSRGERMEALSRRPVRDRTVQKDLVFLRAVCRWACEYRDDAGRFLLAFDPTRGLPVPREKNPRRPVATHDRVDAIRSVYREPQMRIGRTGNREAVESYLPEVFEIVVGTGRRISAVCRLREEDMDLARRESAPWGAIVWPEDTDKMGKRWRCPVNATVREALESALLKRLAVGPGCLFPGLYDPSRPVQFQQVSEWLERAERLAKLKSQKGGLWHPYRRLWASSRKDLPDVDVAQAGGWASLDALKMAYQQPDEATMLRVVTHEVELREIR